MESQKLYQRLKQRQVQEVFKSVIRDLARLGPDGKEVHRRKNMEQTLQIDGYLVKELHGADLTLSQYMEKEPQSCKRDIEQITEAIVIHGITI